MHFENFYFDSIGFRTGFRFYQLRFVYVRNDEINKYYLMQLNG